MQFTITTGPDFMRVVLSGRLTREDVIILGKAVHEAEQAAARTPNRLTDVSGVDIYDITGADIEVFARNRREARYRNPFLHAIYAPQPLQFGYGRMFQTLLDHKDITTRVFNDKAAAEAWLTTAKPGSDS